MERELRHNAERLSRAPKQVWSNLHRRFSLFSLLKSHFQTRILNLTLKTCCASRFTGRTRKREDLWGSHSLPSSRADPKSISSRQIAHSKLARFNGAGWHPCESHIAHIACIPFCSDDKDPSHYGK